MLNHPTLRWIIFLAVLPLLNGCIFYPRTVTEYSEQCDALVKKMELDVTEALAMSQCTGDECISKLLTLGIIGSVSAVVSGTVVVTGNFAYWLERQTQC